MAGTVATHLGMDLSKDKPSICEVYGETEGFYLGNWWGDAEHLGVMFPKKSTVEVDNSNKF